MTRSRGWWGPATLIVSVFVAGALSGAATVRWMEARTPEAEVRTEPTRRDGDPGPERRQRSSSGRSSNRFLDQMEERLGLSATQVEQIDSIMQAQRRRSREVMESIRPQLSAALDSMNLAIEDVLQPEQRPGFQEMLEEARKRSDRSRRDGDDRRRNGEPPREGRGSGPGGTSPF